MRFPVSWIPAFAGMTTMIGRKKRDQRRARRFVFSNAIAGPAAQWTLTP
jgi:hypothetical protein